MRSNVLYFLFLIIPFIRSDFESAGRVKRISFLYGYLKNTSTKQIFQYYKREMFDLFGLEIFKQDSIEEMFKDMQSISVGHLNSLKEFKGAETLVRELGDFLKRPKIIEPEDKAQVHRFTTKLFNLWVTQIYFKDFDEKPDILLSHVAAAFEELKTKAIVPINVNTDKFLEDVYGVIRDSIDKKLELYKKFIEFKKSPFESVKSMLLSLADYLGSVRNELISTEEIEEKIRGAVAFVSQDSDFESVFEIGNKLIQRMSKNEDKKSILNTILTGIFKIFLRASGLEEQKFGKMLFLSFFNRLENQSPLPNQFKEFIVYKYRLEKLKFGLTDKREKYPQLVTFYVLDLFEVSLQTNEDFISQSDIAFVFFNFVYFSSDIKEEVLDFLTTMKQLLTNKELKFSEFYTLFSGLYDSIILSGPYFNEIRLAQDWKNAPVLFDGYLDYLMKWESSTIRKSISEWQPNNKDFDIRILTNYFFYKLINLEQNFKHFKGIGFSFSSFTKFDDILIHRFTLLPEIKMLLNHLRKQVHNKGFNYKNFSKVSFTSDHLIEYSKKIKLFKTAQKHFAIGE